jgi:hypothetical protein
MGGRWAVSWVTYVAVVVACMLGVALEAPGSVGAWAVLVLITIAACIVVIALADVTVLRNRRVRPVAPALMVGVAALGGLARAAALLVPANAMGISLERSAFAVAVGSVLTAVLGISCLALASDAVARHRELREGLTARLVALREQDGERSGLAEAMTDAAYVEMLDVVGDARRGLEAPVGSASLDDHLMVAEQIRDIVNTRLRPLSHRLYALGRRADPHRDSRWRVAWSAFRAHPVSPLAAGAVMAIITVPFARLPGTAIGLGVLMWAVLALVVAIGRRVPWVSRNELPLACAALAVLGAAFVAGLRLAFDTPNPWVGAVVAAVGVPLTATAVSVVLAFIRGDQVMNDRLAAQLADTEVAVAVADRELARASRDLAQYVHGTLQSNLLAIAFSIEKGVESGDPAACGRAVTEARAVLAGSPEAIADHPADLPAALDRVSALWRGFIALDVRVDPDLVLSPGQVEDVARVVGEAVANARKHGAARSAQVSVTGAHGAVDVIVLDDGSGPDEGLPGMGSAWLDFVAPGAWALEPGPDGTGTRLHVRLAAVPQSLPAGSWR